MMQASDAKAIADKVNTMRLCIQEDAYHISEQVFESSKKGLYEIKYDVFYDDTVLVESLMEEIKPYGYLVDYSPEYKKEQGIFYTVTVKWN